MTGDTSRVRKYEILYIDIDESNHTRSSFKLNPNADLRRSQIAQGVICVPPVTFSSIMLVEQSVMSGQ